MRAPSCARASTLIESTTPCFSLARRMSLTPSPSLPSSTVISHTRVSRSLTSRRAGGVFCSRDFRNRETNTPTAGYTDGSGYSLFFHRYAAPARQTVARPCTSRFGRVWGEPRNFDIKIRRLFYLLEFCSFVYEFGAE